MTSYSRATPSPEYLDMVAMYETLHEEGEAASKKSGQDTFSGKMLIQHAPGIAEMIKRTGAETILDYGAGKGAGFERRETGGCIVSVSCRYCAGAASPRPHAEIRRAPGPAAAFFVSKPVAGRVRNPMRVLH